MATEADLIQKFKDLNIPVGADFEELIHAAFASSNLADLVNSKADDSKVVHTADMRKPASDVVGLEEVSTAYNQYGIADGTDVQSITKEGLYQLNGISLINFIGSGSQWGVLQVIHQGTVFLQIARMADGSIYTNAYAGNPFSWLGWKKVADDSKVAHLSGANNFDTTPTVNNNPLLLASSLPSDLARTSQQTNFTVGLQKGGKDVATISDVTTAVNTATANMVDRDPSTGVVSDSTTFSDLKVGNGQQVASIDVASSEQEATDKASKFTAPGIVIY